MFSLEQFNYGGVLDYYGTSKGFESEEARNMGEFTHLYGKGGYWGEATDIDSFSSDFGVYAGNTADDGLILSKNVQEHQRHFFSDLDDLYLDVVSPSVQSCHEEITKLATVQTENWLLDEPKKERFPFASLGILKNYGSGFRRLNQKKIKLERHGTACTKPKVDGRNLSTDSILRLAGEKFIQSSSQRINDLSVLSHPYNNTFLGLSDAETRDVELVQNLLASAEKVGQQQYDRASKLLSQCDELSSDTGNPVQRVVYCFSKALREKINRETGRITSKGTSGKKELLDLSEAMVTLNVSALITFHQEVPFSQICLFPAVQAIIEGIAEAKKVHLIELEIRDGIQCTVMMQALASRPQCSLELFKVTAVGTKSKLKIEETGKRLMSFAESLNMPFSFNVVMVSDMLDLKKGLFDLEAEETVAFNAPFSLWPMLAMPDRLESLMRVIRDINPCLMVVTEVEANLNSPVFVNRFIEALFFFGANFDCLEECTGQNSPHRQISEAVYFGQTIHNIVSAEGEERIIRHVNISIWRTFFARFGMMEEELSTSSLYQASLTAKNFACGSSCTLDTDEKSLIIGWKGTPIHSVSAWKFV